VEMDDAPAPPPHMLSRSTWASPPPIFFQGVQQPQQQVHTQMNLNSKSNACDPIQKNEMFHPPHAPPPQSKVFLVQAQAQAQQAQQAQAQAEVEAAELEQKKQLLLHLQTKVSQLAAAAGINITSFHSNEPLPGHPQPERSPELYWNGPLQEAVYELAMFVWTQKRVLHIQGECVQQQQVAVTLEEEYKVPMPSIFQLLHEHRLLSYGLNPDLSPATTRTRESYSPYSSYPSFSTRARAHTPRCPLPSARQRIYYTEPRFAQRQFIPNLFRPSSSPPPSPIKAWNEERERKRWSISSTTSSSSSLSSGVYSRESSPSPSTSSVNSLRELRGPERIALKNGTDSGSDWGLRKLLVDLSRRVVESMCG
jgi:hypothetical protein